jgi:tetratricopeptide (TPR) repeat protein
MAKRVLCIGINDYPGTANDLAGCVNAAQDWAVALQTRGFTVRGLVDHEATKANMLAAVQELIGGAAPGDSLVITCSGHGTFVPDASGDEPDACDEGLCPYAIAQRLVQADPSHSGWQRDLAVSHERLGDLAVQTGDLKAARESYQQALAIRQRLVQADPSNTEWQRDLSVSHIKLGDLAVQTGELKAARESYQQDFAIAQRLVQANPSNREWQRDLAVSHERLGDLAVQTGELKAARESYQQDLAIAQRLVQADPRNVQWQKDLLLSQVCMLVVAASDNAPAEELEEQLSSVEATLHWFDRSGALADDRQLAAVRTLVAKLRGGPGEDEGKSPGAEAGAAPGR